MKLNCPVCRAENTQGISCRRCKADLGELVALETERAMCIDSARNAIFQRQGQPALEALDQAEAIRPDDDIAPLRALAYLVQSDWQQAWVCYHQATQSHG